MIGGDKVLDEFFKNAEVVRFMRELETNPRYLHIRVPKESVYGKCMQDELALYLFYDCLFKYKLLVNDLSLFDEYLSQVEKLYRKIEDYNVIFKGINQLLINLAAISLDIRDIESGEGKKKIIEHFYQKFIIEGYFIHGYSTTYEELIKGRGFTPEKYPNHYGKMLRAQQILNKHHIPAMTKDFHDDQIYLTDDLIMGCYYSATSPGYFYQLLTNLGVDRISYLKQNYHAAISSLKKYMSNHSFRLSEQKAMIRVVQDEWNFLTRVPRKINLLFVKRNKIMDVSYDKLYEYLDSNKGVYEIINRILTPQYSEVSMRNLLKYGEYQMISFDDFYMKSSQTDQKSFFPEQTKQLTLLNSYGVVSVCLIAGSILISLGVIVTIIMILRGM